MPRPARPSIRAFVSLLSITSMLALALSACASSSTSATHPTPSARQTPAVPALKFVIVGSAPDSDPTWGLIKRGADQAAKGMGVTVSYVSPATSDSAALSQLISTTISNQPDGVITSLPDCAVLSPSVQQAQLVGISVIAINSGSDCATKLGVLSYIGQIDYQAGLQGGQKLASAGSRHVICITSDASSPTLNDRCRGVSDALKKVGGHVDTIPVNVNNSSAAQQRIQSLLVQDPTINGAITVDANTAAIAIPAAQQLVRASSFYLATFDLSTPILQAIQQGSMLFAIDQQPYLQGYLAVVWLSLYKKNLETVVNPIISTGPSFVNSANVAAIEQLVANGTH